MPFQYLFNCVAHKCNSMDYDSKDKNFHEYGPFASSICDTAIAGCLDAARQQLLCNSAPGQGACAIVGKEIPQGLSGGNPITQYAVNPDMVINGTSPGHVFHDGYVVRWLAVNEDGVAQIWTYGRGVNTDGAAAFGNKWVSVQSSHLYAERSGRQHSVHLNFGGHLCDPEVNNQPGGACTERSSRPRYWPSAGSPARR